MDEQLPLSILIVMHNGAAEVDACLSSIREHVRCECETIVLDNASSDGSVGRLRVTHPDVSVIESPINIGFGAGANRAARNARGVYLLVLNQDVRLLGDLQPALEILEQRRDVGVVGARMQDDDGGYRPSAGRFPAPLRLLRISSLNRGDGPFANGSFPRNPRAYEVDWVEGSFLMTRGDLWRTLDGFDPGYFMYGEDVDYARRALDVGFMTVFTPAVRYLHHGGFEIERMRWIIHGFRRFHERHSGSLTRLLASFVLDVGLALRAALSALRFVVLRRPADGERMRACWLSLQDRGSDRAPGLGGSGPGTRADR